MSLSNKARRTCKKKKQDVVEVRVEDDIHFDIGISQTKNEGNKIKSKNFKLNS